MNYEAYDADEYLFAEEEARELQAFLDAQLQDARDLVEKTAPGANFKAACLYAADLILYRVETEDPTQWKRLYGAQPLEDGAHLAADLRPSDNEIDALEASVRERLREVDALGPWGLERQDILEIFELLQLSAK
jgi:hypothetical protein